MKRIIIIICLISIGISNSFSQEKKIARMIDKKSYQKTSIIKVLELSTDYSLEYNNLSKVDDSIAEHERYILYYKGIKIENSDIRVHYYENKVIINGEYFNVTDIDTSINITKDEALVKAKLYFKRLLKRDDIKDSLLKSYHNIPEIVLCKNYFDFNDNSLYLAYKIDMYVEDNARHDYIYVSSINGNILNCIPINIEINGIAETRYSGTQNISTQLRDLQYVLRDTVRGIETYNLHNTTDIGVATDFTDEDNYWSSSEFDNVNKDNAALDVHWGVMKSYDYFKQVHNRDSYDNNNGIIKNYVHYGKDSVYAAWSRLHNVMFYGDGNNIFDAMTSLDIVAHEFGHGVCQYTAGLIYQGESGAINESLSDIWGVCIENYSTMDKQIWLIGEDIGCPLRSMSNPNFIRPTKYI